MAYWWIENLEVHFGSSKHLIFLSFFFLETKCLIELHEVPQKGRADSQDGGCRASPSTVPPSPNGRRVMGYRGTGEPPLQLPCVAGLFWMGFAHLWETALPKMLGCNWCSASLLPFLPLKVMRSQHTLATKNKRTLFLLFISNENQQWSFIFSCHLIFFPALWSTQAGAHMLVNTHILGTFSLDDSGLEVLWKKDVVFHDCFVFPHQDLDWTGKKLNKSVWWASQSFSGWLPVVLLKTRASRRKDLSRWKKTKSPSAHACVRVWAHRTKENGKLRSC